LAGQEGGCVDDPLDAGGLGTGSEYVQGPVNRWVDELLLGVGHTEEEDGGGRVEDSDAAIDSLVVRAVLGKVGLDELETSRSFVVARQMRYFGLVLGADSANNSVSLILCSKTASVRRRVGVASTTWCSGV